MDEQKASGPVDRILAALVRETDDHGMTRIQLGEVHAIAAELDRLRAENEALRAAAGSLRHAQKAYMADRGNEALGKAVAVAAARLDAVLAPNAEVTGRGPKETG